METVKYHLEDHLDVVVEIPLNLVTNSDEGERLSQDAAAIFAKPILDDLQVENPWQVVAESIPHPTRPQPWPVEVFVDFVLVNFFPVGWVE